MLAKLFYVFAGLVVSMSFVGCVFVDDDGLDPGFVQCGQEEYGIVCQPGTYCSAPNIRYCSEGCVSDVNCLPQEHCFKEKEGDRVGVCIPTKKEDPEPSPCCGG